MCLRVSYTKKYEKNNFFCILKVTEERSRIQGSGSGSINQSYGCPDPDPHQNVSDPNTVNTEKIKSSLKVPFLPFGSQAHFL